MFEPTLKLTLIDKKRFEENFCVFKNVFRQDFQERKNAHQSGDRGRSVYQIFHT